MVDGAGNKPWEIVMPVLIVPLLIGIPVLIGGSFLIYKVVGH